MAWRSGDDSADAKSLRRASLWRSIADHLCEVRAAGRQQDRRSFARSALETGSRVANDDIKPSELTKAALRITCRVPAILLKEYGT